MAVTDSALSNPYCGDMPARRYVMQDHNTRHSRRRVLLTGAAVLLAAVGLSTSSGAATASRLTIVTVRHTMALPGATLPPGTYTFEILNPGSSADVVVVRGARSGEARFMGLTRRVDRPPTLAPDQTLAIGEAPPGEPVPITAWYPIGFRSGHQFLY
jgi:hypothetical protein